MSAGVIRDRTDRSCPPVDVRFPPKATEAPLCSEMTRRAISGHRPRPFLSELHGQFGSLLFAGTDHIDRAAIPRMFERKRDDFPDTDATAAYPLRY
jgi:hypothetical protein